SSAPRFDPSSRNCTPTTPTLSEASAVTFVVPETVAPLGGAVIDTVGGVVSGAPLETVTVTGSEVFLFPAASRATAVSVCEPFEVFVVSQEIWYGATVSSAPRFDPSSRNCTPTAPTLSETSAVTFVVPETVAPLGGAVIETVGGVVSGAPLETVTVTGSEVFLFPAASRATAVSVCEPFEVFVVSQEIWYGATVSSAPRFDPSSRNCTPTAPTLSETSAVTFVVPETVAPLGGAVIETVGGVLSGAPLETVTVTGSEVFLFPAASRATAVSVCEPFEVFVVSQEIWYGATVSSAPRFDPSSRNCTPITPTLSEASAETGVVPETVAPLTGAVIEIEGGVVSGGGRGGRPSVSRLIAFLVAAS